MKRRATPSSLPPEDPTSPRVQQGRFATLEALVEHKNARLMELLEGVDLTTLFEQETPKGEITDELTPEQRQRLELSIEQAKNGETLSNHEVLHRNMKTRD